MSTFNNNSANRAMVYILADGLSHLWPSAMKKTSGLPDNVSDNPKVSLLR